MSLMRTLVAAYACACLIVPVAAATQSSAPSDRATVIKVATEIMAAAKYCTLITIGEDGQPQARIVDPFPPTADMTVWLATNPITRKVAQIRKDPRVTLFYFDSAKTDYVSLLGTAELVTDPAEKAKHWKDAWKALYRDANRGDDYMLIKVTARRLEVESPARGMFDPRTWRPTILDLK